MRYFTFAEHSYSRATGQKMAPGFCRIQHGPYMEWEWFSLLAMLDLTETWLRAKHLGLYEPIPLNQILLITNLLCYNRLHFRKVIFQVEFCFPFWCSRVSAFQGHWGIFFELSDEFIQEKKSLIHEHKFQYPHLPLASSVLETTFNMKWHMKMCFAQNWGAFLEKFANRRCSCNEN